MLMERLPEYKLDFEIRAFLDVKNDNETVMKDGSRFILYKVEDASKDYTNKGSVIFHVDTLNFGEAKKIGMAKVESFLNFLIVLLNIENIPSTKFDPAPSLLSFEKIGKPIKIMQMQITGNASVQAIFNEKCTFQVKDKIDEASKLSKQQKNSLANCLNWLRRGADASGNDRFIYRWISLEALFGVLKLNGKTTVPLINELVGKLKNESLKGIYERNKEIVNQLVEANLEGYRGAKPSGNLKTAIEADVGYTHIIQKTALCVYEVRNKLIHTGEALLILDGCSSFLRDLISTCVRDLL